MSLGPIYSALGKSVYMKGDKIVSSIVVIVIFSLSLHKDQFIYIVLANVCFWEYFSHML